ncbi:hypothetical protein [Crateriforma conspicua]|uniref:Uncharacterized protein n=1 Tax=Crateriforma conspicua TaxID=2527996 RepID=A0A5C5Y709_9PLAN|nr:hypothetical protein [Crateriforma conspicua]QDV65680.1 hypothetical protein Mal65_48530 [Crateriforma conspicua]TWT71080.1 hypothetical protein Pan14r_33900 [Crateriforma conspicua]
MSTKRRNSGPEMGHDAFLDIVANLVGILIILVVVLGSQSKQVLDEADPAPVQEMATDDQMSTLAQYAMKAASAQADSDRLEASIKLYEAKLDAQRQKRGMLLDLVSEAESAWEEMKADLDQAKVQQAARWSSKQKLEAQLASVRGERERLENVDTPTVQIAHLPTPMAKTVFGDEVHFRLKGNQLSVIPLDGLLRQLERDLKLAFAGKREGRQNSVVGPVRGYLCRYEFEKNRGLTSRGGRVAMATEIRPVRFVFEPVEEPFGQSMDVILSGRSQLDIELAGRDPATTTVTIWVYPDSYRAFRKLKEHLYAKGFATAARPLAADQKITASPYGSRSAAQ